MRGCFVAEQDAGGDAGEDVVDQADAECLLVHQVMDAEELGGQADRDGGVSAGADDGCGPGACDGEGGLGDAQGL